MISRITYFRFVDIYYKSLNSQKYQILSLSLKTEIIYILPRYIINQYSEHHVTNLRNQCYQILKIIFRKPYRLRLG
jgi:hypothetical protein